MDEKEVYNCKKRPLFTLTLFSMRPFMKTKERINSKYGIISLKKQSLHFTQDSRTKSCISNFLLLWYRKNRDSTVLSSQRIEVTSFARCKRFSRVYYWQRNAFMHTLFAFYLVRYNFQYNFKIFPSSYITAIKWQIYSLFLCNVKKCYGDGATLIASYICLLRLWYLFLYRTILIYYTLKRAIYVLLHFMSDEMFDCA